VAPVSVAASETERCYVYSTISRVVSRGADARRKSIVGRSLKEMVTKMAKLFKWFKDTWKGSLAADVPPELAQCEFECKVQACSHGRWASCENRIRCMNAEIAHMRQKLPAA
jgi:hypothetical protein